MAAAGCVLFEIADLAGVGAFTVAVIGVFSLGGLIFVVFVIAVLVTVLIGAFAVGAFTVCAFVADPFDVETALVVLDFDTAADAFFSAAALPLADEVRLFGSVATRASVAPRAGDRAAFVVARCADFADRDEAIVTAFFPAFALEGEVVLFEDSCTDCPLAAAFARAAEVFAGVFPEGRTVGIFVAGFLAEAVLAEVLAVEALAPAALALALEFEALLVEVFASMDFCPLAALAPVDLRDSGPIVVSRACAAFAVFAFACEVLAENVLADIRRRTPWLTRFGDGSRRTPVHTLVSVLRRRTFEPRRPRHVR